MTRTAEQTAREVKLFRSLGATTRRRKLPRQTHPSNIERDYRNHLLRLVATTRTLLEPMFFELEQLASRARGVRMNTGEGRRMSEIIDGVRERIASSVTRGRIEPLLERLASSTSVIQRAQIMRQIKAGLGVDLFVADAGLAQLVDGFVAENVALIKSVPTELLSRLERTITRGFASALPVRDLSKLIENEFSIARDSSRRIARDQIGKLNGQMNAQRQRSLGVTEFVWRTVRDERVRPAHSNLDGRKFKFSQPPSEGLPGEPIQCRCSAEPVFDKILGAAA